MTEFGKRLGKVITDMTATRKRFRFENGITQKRMRRLFEQEGEERREIHFVEKMCEQYGVSASWLMNGDGLPYPGKGQKKDRLDPSEYESWRLKSEAEIRYQLRRMMRSGGITQKEVAEMAGMSQGSLSMKMTGARPFRKDEIERILFYLDMTKAQS